MMQRLEVDSSSIDTVGYDEETQILEIEFRVGVYQYEDVPEYIYHDFMNADSKGRFFHENIKYEYFCSRVE